MYYIIHEVNYVYIVIYDDVIRFWIDKMPTKSVTITCHDAYCKNINVCKCYMYV